MPGGCPPARAARAPPEDSKDRRKDRATARRRTASAGERNPSVIQLSAGRIRVLQRIDALSAEFGAAGTEVSCALIDGQPVKLSRLRSSTREPGDFGMFRSSQAKEPEPEQQLATGDTDGDASDGDLVRTQTQELLLLLKPAGEFAATIESGNDNVVWPRMERCQHQKGTWMPNPAQFP